MIRMGMIASGGPCSWGGKGSVGAWMATTVSTATCTTADTAVAMIVRRRRLAVCIRSSVLNELGPKREGRSRRFRDAGAAWIGNRNAGSMSLVEAAVWRAHPGALPGATLDLAAAARKH
jgi:hypothetical protein